jgi:hypothetical protein
MKIKKHQKNITSLIHNYANGVQKEMVSGNVSSIPDGDETRLVTYSTTLAKRKVFDDVNRNAVFLINSRTYSVSSTRHKGALYRSIPLEIPCPTEATLDWKTVDEFIQYRIKQGYAVTFPIDGPFFSFSHSVVEDVAKQIGKFLEHIGNKRIRSASVIDIWRNYKLLKTAQWFQKVLNQRDGEEKRVSKALRNVGKKFRKTAQEYVARVEDYNARKGELRQKRLDDSVQAVRSKLNQFGESYRDAVDVCLEELRFRREAWRQGVMPMHLTSPFSVFSDGSKKAGLMFRSFWEELQDRKKHTAFDSFTSFVRFIVEEVKGADALADTGEVLRVEAEEVATSRGARVPEGIASRVFRRHAEELRKDAHKFEPPVAVGPFQMREVADGFVLIGCHRINQRDLLRLAEERGW